MSTKERIIPPLPIFVFFRMYALIFGLIVVHCWFGCNSYCPTLGQQ